ncbi:GNAT family N-acetyltransferase [Campylobacter sp.]|uniref:GNAT family N-acetyltransferase n=1 Tax=Campylobacter sp. TaxID=205 RepID=UPI0027056656|nr:GNAT family N-acetyltransferase [Campylobacter sp.]
MITQADKKDALRCIELLNLAMDEIAFALSGSSDILKSNEILTSFFMQDVNRLSYKNVYVFKLENKIVGAVCAYCGGDIKMLDAPILAHLQKHNLNAKIDKECFEDEFYIDSVAVDEKFRGRGIASELIKFTFEAAKLKGYAKVALIVDENKVKEREFYERLGFVVDRDMIVNSHNYHHMIKEIL